VIEPLRGRRALTPSLSEPICNQIPLPNEIIGSVSCISRTCRWKSHTIHRAEVSFEAGFHEPIEELLRLWPLKKTALMLRCCRKNELKSLDDSVLRSILVSSEPGRSQDLRTSHSATRCRRNAIKRSRYRPLSGVLSTRWSTYQHRLRSKA
jgi:hypothetical protein